MGQLLLTVALLVGLASTAVAQRTADLRAALALRTSEASRPGAANAVTKWPRGVKGALAGAVVGGAVGGYVGYELATSMCERSRCPSGARDAMVGAAIGGVAGAGLGALTELVIYWITR